MTIKRDMEIFLDKLCLELGICLPPSEKEKLVSRNAFFVDDFVREIFIIEGLDLDLHLKLFRQAKKRFTDKFGSQVDE